MSINNKHKVSEKELDNLLGQAFLNLDFNNPKNQELMETISSQVMHTSPVGIINKAFYRGNSSYQPDYDCSFCKTGLCVCF